MTPNEAMHAVVEWGLVVIVGAVLIGVAISMIRSAITGKDDEF